jgi:hypothetical protein
MSSRDWRNSFSVCQPVVGRRARVGAWFCGARVGIDCMTAREGARVGRVQGGLRGVVERGVDLTELDERGSRGSSVW